MTLIAGDIGTLELISAINCGMIYVLRSEPAGSHMRRSGHGGKAFWRKKKHGDSDSEV